MFPPKKILFPVDFSEGSTAAARMVEAFAGRFHSELTMLHVVEPVALAFEFPYDAMTPAKQLMDSYLVEELKNFNVERVLLQGDPGHEIVNYAHQGRFDLIMLPTHGYGRFRRFLLGSIAVKVLHDAMCPVWTSVHSKRIAPLEKIAFRSVACAIDLGPQSCRALKWAAQFVQETGSELTIMHAMPILKGIPEFSLDQNWKVDTMRQAEERIAAMNQSLHIEAEISIVPDDVPDGVRNRTESVAADLLVIGRHSGNGIMGRLRTNAYSIIRQSPCPVVSV
jgi:nucleotide-binding universal stress UspA family protein